MRERRGFCTLEGRGRRRGRQSKCRRHRQSCRRSLVREPQLHCLHRSLDANKAGIPAPRELRHTRVRSNEPYCSSSSARSGVLPAPQAKHKWLWLYLRLLVSCFTSFSRGAQDDVGVSRPFSLLGSSFVRFIYYSKLNPRCLKEPVRAPANPVMKFLLYSTNLNYSIFN